jgi:hypothetical protein
LVLYLQVESELELEKLSVVIRKTLVTITLGSHKISASPYVTHGNPGIYKPPRAKININATF